MKRLFIAMAVVSATVLGFSSCNNEDEVVNSSQGQIADLRIETEITSAETGLRSTKAALSSFPEGSTLSLFVTNGTLGSNYPLAPSANIKAEYQSGKWKLNPGVKLGEDPATVFALYPYNASYTNGGSVMGVNHNSQIDYMYGTHCEGQSAINWNNPNVRLKMKHALALLQFSIRKMNYQGEGKLTKIEVANYNGAKDLISAATIDISTGELTYSQSHHFSAEIIDNDGLYLLTDNESLVPQDVLVLPVKKISQEGNIRINFTIDARIYSYIVPANTTWKQGTKYLYNVLFNGTELVIDDIIISDWIEGAKGEINLY